MKIFILLGKLQAQLDQEQAAVDQRIAEITQIENKILTIAQQRQGLKLSIRGIGD